MSFENAAVDVRKGDELDVAAVDAALKANVSGLSGKPIVKQYPSGASNLTYALDYPDRSLVLRRPPTGTRPKSGHDMHREYRIMTELAPAFPKVPKTLYYTADESIIGAEFYVMDRSALGDPMMDLGNTLAYWIEADDPAFMQMMVRQPSKAPGMMTRQEILDFYAEKSGADVSGFQFYYVYGIFRLAVIIQQIYYRFYHGQTDNPRFKDYGQMVNALGQLARHKIKTGKL